VADGTQAGTPPGGGEAQQIIDQLNASRLSSTLWQVSQPPTFQTQGHMTGGLTGSESSPQFAMQQMMIQNQALQIQQQVSQQAQLRAYAQAVPGATSPSLWSGNPAGANYQLQNMYQMNPYMANFFAGQQGGGGGAGPMNLAPAQLMTSARLGMFRQGTQGDAPQAFGMANLARDVFTLNSPSWRSFAPYEDVLDETMEASRRMSRRKEAAWGGLASAAAMGVGLIPGVGIPVGLALSLGGEAATSLGANAYFQRRAETNRIFDISTKIATGAQSGGPRGVGFGFGESANMMSAFRGAAAESTFFNMSDYMNVLETGADTGMFKFQGDAGGTTSKVKEYVGMLDVLMQLAGDSDVRSVMERMSSLQNLGIAPGQMQNAMANVKTFSRLMGTSVDDFMNNTGAMGAQLAAQQGGLPGMGMMVAGVAGGGVRNMIQQGVMNQTQVAMRGGESGMVQTATQGLLANVQGYLQQNAAAFLTTGAGGLRADTGALMGYINSGNAPGGHNYLA